MSGPLMPKATAVWLLDNSTLTFEQIGEFCNLHPLEVQAIADGELAQGIVGMDPVTTGQLLREEIKRCEDDPTQKLQLLVSVDQGKRGKEGARYTPIARRQDRPNAIYWLLKNCPTITDAQISKLVGTTKTTIDLIRTRKHWNMQNIRAESPVLLGICAQEEIDEMIERNERKANSAPKPKPKKKKTVPAKKRASAKATKKPVAKKTAVKKTTAKKAAVTKVAKGTTKKAVTKKTTTTTKKPAVKKAVVKKETKTAVKKVAAKKSSVKKSPAKKATKPTPTKKATTK